MNRNFDWLRANLGGRWPSTFTAVDIETTGLDRLTDLIWQIGFAEVIDGKLVSTGQWIIDWTIAAVIDQLDLQDRMGRVIRRMEERGDACRLSLDLLKSGRPYQDVFADFVTRMAAWSQGWLVVHNGLRFDLPFIRAALTRFAATPLPECDRVLDTLALTRLRTYGDKPALSPRHQEAADAYQTRVASLSYKVGKLTEICGRIPGFYEKYAISTDSSHFADADAAMSAGLCLELTTGATPNDSLRPTASPLPVRLPDPLAVSPSPRQRKDWH